MNFGFKINLSIHCVGVWSFAKNTLLGQFCVQKVFVQALLYVLLHFSHYKK